MTQDFISTLEDKEVLLEFLNSKKEIKQEQVIEFLLKYKHDLKRVPKDEIAKYRWNYVEDKVYPGNETKALIQSRLDKVSNASADFLNKEDELSLCQI